MQLDIAPRLSNIAAPADLEPLDDVEGPGLLQADLGLEIHHNPCKGDEGGKGILRLLAAK